MATNMQLWIKGLSDSTLSVIELDGEETLGRPYYFDVLLSMPCSAQPLEMLDQAATLQLGSGDSTRSYHGVVSYVDFWQDDVDYLYAKVRLEPRLALLGMGKVTEAYTDEITLPDLIAQCLQAAGLAAGDDFELRLYQTYRARSFVCQYDETTLDFIQRWMETLGLYYFFEQGEQNEKLIICDDHTFLPQTTQAVHFRPAGGLDTHADPLAVTQFQASRGLTPAGVCVQGYDYRKASLPSVSGQQVVAGGQLGVSMLVHENIRVNSTGNTDHASDRARIAAQALTCQNQRCRAELAAPVLGAGDVLTLSAHPYPPFNAAHRVVSVRHYGSQGGPLYMDEQGKARQTRYQLNCEVIALDLPFRLARTTPRPSIAGTLPARIDGDAGSSCAQMNEFGEYKVCLPFVNGDKPSMHSSAWLRLATQYAGEQHGMHFPLQPGSEVMLAFQDGDPDQPYILTALGNSAQSNMVTSNNATQNVLQTPGGNRMTLEDQPQAQYIMLSTPISGSYMRLGAQPIPPSSASETAGSSLVPPYVPTPSAGGCGLSVAGKDVFTVLQPRINGMALNPPDHLIEYPLALNADGSLDWIDPNAIPDENDDGNPHILFATKGGSATVVHGDSDSVTGGASYKYTGGSSYSLTLGNSTALTIGDSCAEVQGDTVAYNFGSASQVAFGARNTVNIGVNNTANLGSNNTVNLAAAMTVNAGLMTTAALGVKLDFTAGIKSATDLMVSKGTLAEFKTALVSKVGNIMQISPTAAATVAAGLTTAATVAAAPAAFLAVAGTLTGFAVAGKL